MTDKAMEQIDDVDLDTDADLDGDTSAGDKPGTPAGWRPAIAPAPPWRQHSPIWSEYHGSRALLTLRLQQPDVDSIAISKAARWRGVKPYVDACMSELQDTDEYRELALRTAQLAALEREVASETAALNERLHKLRVERADADKLDLRAGLQRLREIEREIRTIEGDRTAKQTEIADARARIAELREDCQDRLDELALPVQHRHVAALRVAREQAIEAFLAKHRDALEALAMQCRTYEEGIRSGALADSLKGLIDKMLRSTAPAEPVAAVAAAAG